MYTIDPLNGDLVMDRGDFVDPRFTITDSAGAPLNVVGATFKLTVKSSLDDALAAAVFQLTSPTGFDLTQAASGIVDALITEGFTEGLAGDFCWDLEMTLAGKKRTLVSAALFRVLKEVTDTGASPPLPSVGVLFPSWIGITDFLYWKDAADGKWIKFRLFNRNMEYVSESTNPPPF